MTINDGGLGRNNASVAAAVAARSSSSSSPSSSYNDDASAGNCCCCSSCCCCCCKSVATCPHSRSTTVSPNKYNSDSWIPKRDAREAT